MSGTTLLIIVMVVGVVVMLARLSALARKVDRASRVEAKVDALLDAQGVKFDPFRDVPPGVREALDRGQIIEAIKRFREATGAGLKESKDFVEELRRRGPGGTVAP